MSLPTSYDLDFSGLAQDLPGRVASRLLKQFGDSPVLLAVLNAISLEVQALSDATNDVIKFRTLPHAGGVNLRALGVIVGQDLIRYSVNTVNLLQETGLSFICEDGVTEWLADIQTPTTVVTDEVYIVLILLKTWRNANLHSSIPELADAIFNLTGFSVIFNRVGLESVDVVIPFDIDETSKNYLRQRVISPQADDSYLLPYPATIVIHDVLYGYRLDIDAVLDTTILR